MNTNDVIQILLFLGRGNLFQFFGDAFVSFFSLRYGILGMWVSVWSGLWTLFWVGAQGDGLGNCIGRRRVCMVLIWNWTTDLVIV